MVTVSGEIDAKHFLIAIVSVVAIVVIAFTVVFATGGFEGAAYSFTNSGLATAIFGEESKVIDADCFYYCALSDKGEEFCLETCER